MLPTVTIQSTRPFPTSDMELLLGVLVAIGALAWMAMTRLRQHRQR